MKRTIVVLVMLAVVATALAAGAAFIIQQNRLSQLKKLAQQAEEKAGEQDYEAAVQILRRVEAAGGTARSTYLLGKCSYAMGKASEAMPYFKRIETQYPRSGFLPDALLYQARYALEAKGDAKGAKEMFLRIIEQHPESEAADFSLLHLARMSHDEGDVAQAKKNLDEILKRTDSAARSEAEFLLGDINMRQLRSPEPGPNDEMYTIQKGDRLINISRKYRVPVEIIEGINNVKASSLSIGQQLKIPRLNLSIVVDKAQRTLTVRNNNQFLKKYRVGINKVDSQIPAGEYNIRAKSDKGSEYQDPETNATVKPGEPGNPLGTRYIELRRGVGIHGTDAPESVGKYIVKGHIAMANQDIEELYPLVNEKTPVTIKGKNLLEDKK
jgi:tetratricopeptide (TPR) repeat protein